MAHGNKLSAFSHQPRRLRSATGTGDPIPAVSHGVLDFLPGGLHWPAIFVAIPSSPQIIFYIRPVATGIPIRRFEAVAVRGTPVLEVLVQPDIRSCRELLRQK